ncbi:MAG: DUF169 domain-containing protein [Deltaproteobacteria bacterium]|nr:DUF169 domain-containing protein [Deltaproteobacteria bacterium]
MAFKAMMTTCEPLEPVYKTYAEKFERILRMSSSYPLAVKMLTKDDNIPEQAKRPLRDFGCYLNTCQCFALSRRTGEMIAQKKDDMWCFEPVIAYGITGGDMDAYNAGLEAFLDGKTRYPMGAKDHEIALKWASEVPRFEPDQYVGIISAPLMRAGFRPDLAILFINPVQLNLVLSGISYQWGESVQCKIASEGGCVNYVVPPIQNGDFWISNPCYGDIASAIGLPSELVISIPMEKVEQLLVGMDRPNMGTPTRYQVAPEGWLPPFYAEMAEILKMHRASK